MSRTTTLVAVAAAMVAASAATASAQTPTTPDAARAPVTFIDDCVGDPQHRPADITLACADAGHQLTALTWSGWGTGRATATGQGVVICEPTCASGRFVRFPVTVVADRLVDGEASARYRRIVVTSGAGRPAFLAARETFRMTTRGPQLVETPAPGTVFTAWGTTWRAVVGGTTLRTEGRGPGERAIRVTRRAYSRGVDFSGVSRGRAVNLNVTGGTCRTGSAAPTGYIAKLTIGSRTLRGCAVPRIIPRATT